MNTLIRLWLFAILGLAFVPGHVALAAEKPAVIKQGGMALPSFFFSRSESLAREACARNLPECRPSVRADMEQEMAVSLVAPWLILGVAVLGALLWMRSRDKKREQHRRSAQRHHNPGTFRKLDKTREDRAEDAARKRERDELAQ